MQLFEGATMKHINIIEFRKTLRKFERLISLQSKQDKCCKGVTLAQCHVLLEIEELKQTKIIELTQRLKLDKSTLSRTIDGLVNIGLIERINASEDRRINLLTLTDQGRKTVDTINKKNNDYYLKAFEKIPNKQHKKIMESFQLLTDALTD